MSERISEKFYVQDLLGKFLQSKQLFSKPILLNCAEENVLTKF